MTVPLGVKGYPSTHCAFRVHFPNDLGCQGFSVVIAHLRVLFGGATARLHRLLQNWVFFSILDF